MKRCALLLALLPLFGTGSALAEEDGFDSFEPDTAPSAQASSPTSGGPLPLSLSVGLGSRRLAYSDDLFGSLRRHQVDAVPVLRADVEWYPGRHLDEGPLGDAGFGLGHQRWLPPSSRRADLTTAYETRAYSTWFGPRLRVPLARGRLVVAYDQGVDAFQVDPGDLLGPSEVPSVRYWFERLQVRWEQLVGGAHRVTVQASGARAVQAGGVASALWFPRARARGLEGQVTVARLLDGGFTAGARLEARRWILDLAPRPGDANVAGGASDDRVTVSLVASWE